MSFRAIILSKNLRLALKPDEIRKIILKEVCTDKKNETLIFHMLQQIILTNR